MATFRSRQRANTRREHRREPEPGQPSPTTEPRAAAAPSEPLPPRSQLITPVADIAGTGHKHRPELAPVPPAPEAKPLVPAASAAPAPTRRRLITPVSELADTTEPPGRPAMDRQEDRQPKVRPPRDHAPQDRRAQPNRHAPSGRRGLPATDTLPTARPAFEHRMTGQTVISNGIPAVLALFVPCPRGLAPALEKELQDLGAQEIMVSDSGISCSGTMDLLMRINLQSRVASRVLLQLAQGNYRNEREINALAMQVDWPAFFTVDKTIKVKTDGLGAKVKSLEYVSLTVKDAVCDRFRQALQARPNVDTRQPDIRIQVFLEPDRATLYLDSSGEALFKRGWRKESGTAPLRENLAAGILLLAGYDGSQPLLDPMCGSGTFLVEAADIAMHRAPGRQRQFAFEQWRTLDAAAWAQLKQSVSAAEKSACPQPIVGNDHDPAMIAISQANLQRAGLHGQVQLSSQDLLALRPPHTTGLMVCNPPYGVRQEELEHLANLYPQLGDWLKQQFAGWTSCWFTGDLRLAKLIRLTVKQRIPLYNGALDCRLFVLPIVAGRVRQDP